MTAGELYEKLLADSREVNRVLKDAENGKITFREAYAHAQRLGELAAQAIRESGGLDGDVTQGQALSVLSPVLRRDYALSQECAEAAVQAANDAAGIGMKPSKARLRADRIRGIASKIAEQGWETVEPVMNAQIVTFSQSAVDDTVRANMNAQAGAGFSPKIVRTADAKACAWCAQLVGTYDYDRVRATGSDVYRRHRDCRCVVEFVPDRSGRRQNVWDKSWRDTTAMRDVVGLDNDREAGRIEARRALDTSLTMPQEKRSALQGKRSPDSMTDEVVRNAIESGTVRDAVNEDLQRRHIIPENGRSYIYGGMEESKRLYDKLKGTGTPIMSRSGWEHKERVENDTIVGRNSQGKETKKLMIIYSGSGSHLYPRRDKDESDGI